MDILNETFDCIIKFASTGNKMNITNFGSFRSHIQPPKPVWNPSTRQMMMSKPKRKTQFRPARKFVKVDE